ncbi:MAG: hypothetical protein ACRYFA_02650 [Janthinobacterium lividum]
MATTNQLNSSLDELPLTTTGEPTDQLTPEEDEELDDTDLDEDDLDDDTNLDDIEPNTDDAEFDEIPLDDDEEDLDEDEVSRLFPGENSYQEDEPDDDEPYEGIRKKGKEGDDLVDDNMTGMPVVPSPS